ncbi:MAG TPA: ComF family protein [Ktedonobacteraceae bacterium]|nr:ComF family protein [Ktedonobacteraceae bacterium]
MESGKNGKATEAGQALRQFLQQGLDLLFPQRCAVCARSGQVLCSACRTSMRLLAPPYCERCNCQLSSPGVCQQCQRWPRKLSGLRAVGTYEGTLRTCIHALKYAGQTRLAEPLGNLLASKYRASGLQTDVIIPVPLHAERLQQRGYNQSKLLAQHCSQQIGVPVREDILLRRRATSAQVGLAARERLQNVAGAFVCAPAFTGRVPRRVLLIDDVCTTGATLEACCEPLFAAGAQEVWALVLARPLL